MTLKKILKGSLLIFVAFGLSGVPWYGSMRKAAAAHCTGPTNRVAIPDIGANLPHHQVLVTTGRTGNVEFFEVCGGFPFRAARYGVLTGQAQEHYDKHHWDHDPGNGVRVSGFSPNGTCTVGTTTYFVYDVFVEEK